MGKIHIEFNTDYEIGDVVVFKKDKILQVGVIEGYYVDDSVVWYNIRMNKNFIYTYTTGGDIAEFNIIHKIEDCKAIKQVVYEED